MERSGPRSARSNEWSAGQRRSRALTGPSSGHRQDRCRRKAANPRPVQPDANLLEPPQDEVRSSMSRRAVACGGFFLAPSRLEVRLAVVQEWRIDGTLEKLSAALRERLRARSGKNPLPSAGIDNSQSAMTSGVGSDRGDTTGARRCGAESAIYWWIPKGWS
jgi:hypothetical protein